MSNDVNKYNDNERTNMSFADLLVLFSSQLRIIIIIPVIFCILSIIYSLFIAEIVYESTSKIMSSSSNNMTKAAGLAAQFGLSLPIGGDSETKWVYPEVIKSRALGRRLLKRKYDTKEFGKQKSLTQILTYGNEQPETSLDTLETEALDILDEMVLISENLKTGVFTLTTRTKESNLSADLNNAILEELDEHQKKHNREKTGKTREFIEERIIETEKDLNKAENSLKNFMDRNRRIENSPLLLLEQQRLNREVTVLTGVFTTLKQQLETTKIEEMREADYVIIVDPPEAPIIRSEPKRKKIVIIAGVLGVFLGLIAALFIDLSRAVGTIERKKFQVAKLNLIENIKLIRSNLFSIFK